MKRRRWSMGALAAVIAAICVATLAPEQPQRVGAQPGVEVALSLSPTAIAVRTGAGLTVKIKI